MEKVDTVVRVNEVDILLINNAKKLMPIKPICEAMGINYSSQLQKIKNDEILDSTVVLSTTVGADKKEREMVCLPLEFIFGWIFTINAKNISEEARPTFLKYKRECYRGLFKYFSGTRDFLEQKQMALEQQMERVEEIKTNFQSTKKKLDEENKKLQQIKSFTYEEWEEQKNQLFIEFID